MLSQIYCLRKWLAVLLFFSPISAFAGTVSKQKGCRVLIDGLESPKIGQRLTVIGNDNSRVPVKIISVSMPKAIVAEILGKKDCPDMVGATVEGEGGESQNKVAGKKKSGGGGHKPFLDVVFQGGVSTLNNKQDFGGGTQTAFSFMGPEVGLLPEFFIPFSPMMAFSVGAGGMWQSLTAPIKVVQQLDDGSTVTTSLSLKVSNIYLRGSVGMNIYFNRNTKMTIRPSFDFLASGTFTVNFSQGSASKTGTAKFKSGTRFGGEVSFDYMLDFGLLLGIGGNVLMTSLTGSTTSSSSTSADGTESTESSTSPTIKSQLEYTFLGRIGYSL